MENNSIGSGLEGSMERYHQELQRKPANNLYETVGFVADWLKKIPKDHREIFIRDVFPKYLKKDTIYYILLSGDAKIQDAAPILQGMLQKNITDDPNSSENPHLVMSLGNLKYAPAYKTIEQFFIDSEHTFVPLEALARIDFKQTVDKINKAFNREYQSWKRTSPEQLKQRLSSMFTSLFYDVGPQGALDRLSESAEDIKLDPYFVKEAFAEAFEHYWANGRRIVFPKRAYYFTKQVTRILTGKQKPRHSK